MTCIGQNIQNIRKIIQKKAVRPIKIIGVTKNRSVEEIEECIKAGIGIIGENRIQEAKKKFHFLKSKVEKHFIGHLQKNKVRKALELFDVIESVDSLELAKKIDSEAYKLSLQKKFKIPVSIFLQVNISHDPQKYGLNPLEIPEIAQKIRSLPNLSLEGLMAILKHYPDVQMTRKDFRALRKLADEINVKELSMGMSENFQIALEEGATMVRLGTFLFKKA